MSDHYEVAFGGETGVWRVGGFSTSIATSRLCDVRLRERASEVKIVTILSMCESRDSGLYEVRMRFNGYLLKGCPLRVPRTICMDRDVVLPQTF